MRNLLIGNGINIKYAGANYKPVSIRKRFRSVLLASSTLYESLLSCPINDSLLEDFDQLPENANIEVLSNSVYNRLKETACKNGAKDSDNLARRITAALKVSALTAIFFDGEKKLTVNIPTEDAKVLKSFDKVYTLSYYEYWNPADEQCQYLHGSIQKLLSRIPDTSAKPVLLFDQSRYNASKESKHNYFEKVDELEKEYELYSINEGDFLFSPSNIDKLFISTLHLSGSLYLDWDLILLPDHSRCYEKIENLDSLFVFGVSPFGDDKLISAIKEIPKVTVFIHDLGINDEELDAWQSKLNQATAEYKDANVFWKLS